MQQLRQYKRLLRICCVSACEGKNDNYIFQVRFEQVMPHSLFKYQIIKHQEEVKQLYQKLEEDIFDFENPFNNNVIRSITKPTNEFRQQINASLQQSIQRIDVITHQAFIAFYSIHLHYQDFLDGLTQETEAKVEEHSMVNTSHGGRQTLKISDYKSMVSKSNEWRQGSALKKEKNSDETVFQKMTNLLQPLQGCQLQLMSQTEILGFRLIRYHESQLLYVLEQPKKTTKIKNFIKNVFRYNSSGLGYLSIHRKQQGKYIKKSSLELLAEPLSMSFVSSTNMILVTTALGVYIYLCKMESRLEQVQIFSYVQLLGCVDCANNSMRGELYLLCRAEIGQLHVYSINQQKLMKTQYRYYEPSALCFEQHHSRLYISDKEGIHVYSVVQYFDLRRLHTVKVDSLYKQLNINHGYLLCLSEKGFMTVLELKPLQKEKLLNVTTTISLPQNCTNIVGSSKNKRLLVTHYRRNIVMIDTIEGPIFSLPLKLADRIQAIFSDQQAATILSVTTTGYLSVARLNPSII